MRIKEKLIILLLAVGLLPSLLVSIIAYTVISRELTTNTMDRLASIAVGQHQRLSAVLEGDKEDTIQLTLNFSLQNALNQYLSNPTVINKSALVQLLRDAKAGSPNIKALSITDTNGIVIASTISESQGKKLPSDEYVVRSGQQATVRLRDDPRDDINKLYVTTNIVTGKKQLGVMVIAYGLGNIVSIIQDYAGLGSTGETVIAGQESGKVISLFALRFDNDAALHTKLDNLHLFPAKESVNQDLTDYRGKQVMVATQPIDAADWVMATKIDRSEALASITILRNAVLIIFLISAVIILLIAIYWGRFFSAPIVALTKKTQAIASGDFSQRIAVDSSDEIGILGRTFNEMTNKLAESYRALEQKVLERTSVLNQKLNELQEAKAKEDAILGSIGEGMIVTNNVGTILLINTIAAELLGIDQAASAGKAVAAFPLYDQAETLIPLQARPIQMALTTGHKVIDEIKSIQGNVKRSLGITATPVIQQGRIIGAIQIIRDITKEKEVDRMKTEFISIASHQLRTPLSAIKWFSEMLLAGDAGELKQEQTDFTKNIAASTERMIDLVNSLLNISRIESGRIIIDPKPTDLQELVQGIVNDLKAKIDGKKQNLVISVHSGLPKINLDPHLIGQVYLNLLTNAIKYTPTGGDISVLISRKNDQIISQVSDNGYGIPKSQQAKMFQKFFRAENIIKIESDGTGLGMYLVKAIIESSGGKIWFESEENKGTTFWFSLPFSGMKAKAGEVTLGS